MTHGKKLRPPQLKIVTADQPRYASIDEVWQVVGPILAQMLAKMIENDRLIQPDKKSKKTNMID